MLTLYDFDNSVCCQKVRITLEEKRIDYQINRVNLFKSEQYSPEYLKINPKGVVPSLIHEGRAVNESSLICEYLDDVFPTPSLVPSDPYLRTKMRFWSKAVDEGLHEGVTELTFSASFRERMKNMTEAERETRFRNIGDPKRRDRFKSTFEHGTRSPFVVHAVSAFERAFRYLEIVLSEGGPWILGDKVSLADVNLMPYVARLAYLGLLPIWISDRPAIQGWWNQVQDWQSFRKGLREPITDADMVEMKTHGAKILSDIASILDEIRMFEAAAAKTT